MHCHLTMAIPRCPFSRLVLVLSCFLVLSSLVIRISMAAASETEESNNGDNNTKNDGGGGSTYVASSNKGGVDEISELCTADMNSFLPPPYNNITKMVCTPVWKNFLLRYQKGEDNLVTFILSAVYTSGWVGMGFSKDGRMVGSSAVVGWFNKKGHPRIKQYYLQGKKPSEVIEDAGELDLTKIPLAVVIHGAMIHLAFQARFQRPLAKQPIILAFGMAYPNHFRLSLHDDKTAMLFDFSAGSASAADINQGRTKKTHGILGTLTWGLFLPVGAIVARYLKHKDPLWYYLHAMIQFVGFLLLVATVVLGQQFYAAFHPDVPAHRGIGIFVLTLSILQILAFFLRPNKDAKIRKYWNWYHHWFGRIALFFGALNVVIGINVGHAGSAWKIGYGFLVSAVLISVIVLEILSWMRRRSEKNIPPPDFQLNPI